MKKHKKIYYVGGLISLIFIPILFWHFANPMLKKLNLRAIEFGLPYKEKEGEKTHVFNHIPINGWNYTTVNVPSNFSETKEKEFYDLVKKLQSKNIDKTGIKFQLNNNNTYNDLVRLINIMMKSKQEAFGLDTEKTNSFYVVHFKKDPNKTYFGDDTVETYINQADYDYKNANIWQKIIKYFPRQFYYWILGFLILIYCSIFKPKITI